LVLQSQKLRTHFAEMSLLKREVLVGYDGRQVYEILVIPSHHGGDLLSLLCSDTQTLNVKLIAASFRAQIVLIMS